MLDNIGEALNYRRRFAAGVRQSVMALEQRKLIEVLRRDLARCVWS